MSFPLLIFLNWQTFCFWEKKHYTSMIFFHINRHLQICHLPPPPNSLWQGAQTAFRFLWHLCRREMRCALSYRHYNSLYFTPPRIQLCLRRWTGVLDVFSFVVALRTAFSLLHPRVITGHSRTLFDSAVNFSSLTKKTGDALVIWCWGKTVIFHPFLELAKRWDSGSIWVNFCVIDISYTNFVFVSIL